MQNIVDKELNRELLDFLDSCHSQYHAVANIRSILLNNGFTELYEGIPAKTVAGGKYFVIRNNSACIAFVLPKDKPCGVLISASHSDSPTFKVKDNPEIVIEGKYVKLNVEKYGGMLCAPWLDRPLTVAGKVLVVQGDSIVSKAVYIDKDLLIIPNVAIHMNRNANTGFEYKANIDMLPLFGGEDAKDKFLKLIAESIDVKPEDIVGTDLYLCVREKGRTIGVDDEFIASARLDDLQCAFTSLKAFLNAKAPETHALIYMVADNEEIGSDTKQGAGSTMLRDVLNIIAGTYGVDDMETADMLANSFMLSCDNAHAVHPNHSEYADQSNRPYLNGGVVIKYGVRYATDSVSEAIFKRICALANVPYQTYSNRSDMAGGSTLGNISNTQVALNTVDIGAAQLAMHSCYETAGACDTKYMVDAITAFYNSVIMHEGCGNYSVKLKK